MVKFNDWGPYDYHRDFNLTYPVQLSIDLSKSIGTQGWLENTQPRFGIRLGWRSLDEYSVRFDPDPSLGGKPGSEWEIRTYFHIAIDMR